MPVLPSFLSFFCFAKSGISLFSIRFFLPSTGRIFPPMRHFKSSPCITSRPVFITLDTISTTYVLVPFYLTPPHCIALYNIYIPMNLVI